MQKTGRIESEEKLHIQMTFAHENSCLLFTYNIIWAGYRVDPQQSFTDLAEFYKTYYAHVLIIQPNTLFSTESQKHQRMPKHPLEI
jgi:hypothetical protein